MLTLILAALLVLYADANRSSYYMDAALILSLLGLYGDARPGPLLWGEEDLLVASAFASAIPYVADALVILGVFVMTVGVYGAIRMPDTYTKLHAMSKAVFLGVVSLCASSAVTGDPAIIYRAILIGVFLLVTTPISAFVIARAAFLRGERMEAPGVRDESGKGLPRRTSS